MSGRVCAFGVLVCLLALPAWARKTSGVLPSPGAIVGPLSLRASDWANIGTPQPYPWRNDATGPLTFVFPDATGTINYAYHRLVAPRSVAAPISADIAVTVLTGSPIWRWDMSQPANCSMAPFVALFLWSNGFVWGEFDRWWAFADRYELKPGDATVRATLDPARWLSVLGVRGDQNPAAFAAALNNVSGIGMTFGGGCFFGHGVYTTSGSARFAIRRLSVG